MLVPVPMAYLDPSQRNLILRAARRNAARSIALQIAEQTVHSPGPVGAVGFFCQTVGLQDIADLPAGANDLVDMQPCSKLASTTAGACSFPLGTFNLGVGLTGVYFSFNSGHSWVQPIYHGLTAAGCDPTAEPCTAVPGPIQSPGVPVSTGSSPRRTVSRPLRTSAEPSIAIRAPAS